MDAKSHRDDCSFGDLGKGLPTQVEVVPSGMLLDLMDPQPESIRLEDMCYGLGRGPRFTGQTLLDDVIATHLLLTDEILQRWFDADPILRLDGLLHDGHEGYIGDISTPLKRALAMLSGKDVVGVIATKLDRAIYRALGLYLPTADAYAPVKEADTLALRAEGSRVLPSRAVWAGDPDEPRVAEAARIWDTLPQGREAGKEWLNRVTDLLAEVGLPSAA